MNEDIILLPLTFLIGIYIKGYKHYNTNMWDRPKPGTNLSIHA